MPLLTLKTNLPLDHGETEALAPLFSQATAEMLGKAERYVMVVVEPAVALSFAGSSAPAALVELKSIELAEDRTRQYSARLCDLIEQHLGIPPERVYIQFTNAARPLWGWNRTTFER